MLGRKGWVLLILSSVVVLGGHVAAAQEGGGDHLARRPGDFCPDPLDPRVSVYLPDGDAEACSRLCCEEGEERFEGPCGCGCIWTRRCPPGSTSVRVDGLFYPFERYGDCAVIASEAEGALESYHYREACRAALGGARPDAVLGAEMTSCVLRSASSFVATVEVCCPERAPCDLDWEPAGPDRLACFRRNLDGPSLGERPRAGCRYRWSPASAVEGASDRAEVDPVLPLPANPMTFQVEVECEDGCRYQDSATYRTGPVAGVIKAPSGRFGSLVVCGGSARLEMKGWVGDGIQWDCAPDKTGPWKPCQGKAEGSSILLGPLHQTLWVRAQALCDDVTSLADLVAVTPLCDQEPTGGDGPTEGPLTPTVDSQAEVGTIDEPPCWPEGDGASGGGEDSPAWRVARRDGAGGASHLLVTADSGTGEPVEEVRIELPKRAARAASPSHLPSGWSMERDGGTLVFAGPAADPPVHLKLDVGGRKVPETVDFEVRTAGRTVEAARDEPVAELAPLDTADSLRGIVVLPETVSPGETVQIRPLDPARTPPEGRWTIGGEVLEPVEIETPCAGDGAPARMLELTVPAGWQPGRPLDVVYQDPWGDPVVDVPDAPTEVAAYEGFEDLDGDGAWDPGEPREGAGTAPDVEGGSAVATAGGRACACGAFPDLRARTGLLLDGRRVGPPLSASETTVWLEVPDDVELGPHRVSGWAGAAFGADDGFDLDVIRVEGELDASKLARGGSTTMRLRVVGTEDPVTLRVRNRTPSIISIEGGDDQTAITSGGSDNSLTRTVRGTGSGAFDVQWELPSCSCDDP